MANCSQFMADLLMDLHGVMKTPLSRRTHVRPSASGAPIPGRSPGSGMGPMGISWGYDGRILGPWSFWKHVFFRSFVDGLPQIRFNHDNDEFRIETNWWLGGSPSLSSRNLHIHLVSWVLYIQARTITGQMKPTYWANQTQLSAQTAWSCSCNPSSIRMGTHGRGPSVYDLSEVALP
jgi:hypothetical protein